MKLNEKKIIKASKGNDSSITFNYVIAKSVINIYKELDTKISKLTALSFQYRKTL